MPITIDLGGWLHGFPLKATGYSDQEADIDVLRQRLLAIHDQIVARKTKQNRTPTKGHADALPTSGHETKPCRPTDVAGTKRASRQNPPNHTRTCNELPSVYM